MRPLASLIVVVSRKFSESLEILCVNLIDGTTLFRYPVKVVKESMVRPFQIRNMLLMKLIQ